MGASRVVVLISPKHRNAAARIRRSAATVGMPAGVVVAELASDREGSPFPYAAALDALSRERIRESVVIVDCDLVLDRSWGDALRIHEERRADLTVAVTSLSTEALGRGGLIRTVAGPDSELRWHGNGDAPADARSVTHIGLSVVSANLWPLLFELPLSAQDPYADEFIPQAIELGCRVGVWTHGGYWRDVGTWPRLIEAHCDLLAASAGRGSVSASPPARSWVSASAEVDASARIAPPSVVFGRARIGPGAELRRCVVLPGAEVAPGTVATDTVFAEDGSHAPLDAEAQRVLAPDPDRRPLAL
jgi:ADP-glucose pyrophosphorylase